MFRLTNTFPKAIVPRQKDASHGLHTAQKKAMKVVASLDNTSSSLPKGRVSGEG